MEDYDPARGSQPGAQAGRRCPQKGHGSGQILVAVQRVACDNLHITEFMPRSGCRVAQKTYFSSCRPILDVQPRYGAQVAVLADDRAVTKGERNRGQLHIDD